MSRPKIAIPVIYPVYFSEKEDQSESKVYKCMLLYGQRYGCWKLYPWTCVPALETKTYMLVVALTYNYVFWLYSFFRPTRIRPSLIYPACILIFLYLPYRYKPFHELYHSPLHFITIP